MNMKCLVNILTSAFALFLFGYFQCNGQNFVQNGSFEVSYSCPDSHSQLDSAIGWKNPTAANPDYFHFCSGTNCQNCVPANFNGFQAPSCGQAYIGLFTYHPPNSYRGYAQTKFISPMVQGAQYLISFEVSLGDNHSTAISNIGAYVSMVPISRQDNLPFSQYQPQVKNPSSKILDDKTGWQIISGNYTATGGEEYLTIGNFRPDNLTNFDALPNGTDPRSYYFIDNVRVVRQGTICNEAFRDSISICLGDSALIMGQYQKMEGIYTDTIAGTDTCCQQVFQTKLIVNDWVPVGRTIPIDLCENDSIFLAGQWIDQPGIYYDTILEKGNCEIVSVTYEVSRKEWEWKTQSNTIASCIGDTIWFNGVLFDSQGSVVDTITDHPNCQRVISTTYLIFADVPFIEIPKEITGCKGGGAVVSATTPIVKYLWSNGATDPVVTFKNSGQYWVQRTYGNCTRIDTFQVIIYDPSLFSIGEGTGICPGDTLVLEANVDVGRVRWKNGWVGKKLKITVPGNYWAEWKEKSCNAFASVFIREKKNCELALEIPNLLTPNGDGKNDILEPIEIKGIKQMSTTIYNRWGKKVGSSNEQMINWDPEDLPAGDYFYEVVYSGFVYPIGTKKGSFKIVR